MSREICLRLEVQLAEHWISFLENNAEHVINLTIHAASSRAQPKWTPRGPRVG